MMDEEKHKNRIEITKRDEGKNEQQQENER